MTGNHTSPSSRGFTLIELLVVIAILALLLAIFTPALDQLKDLAAMVSCADRMRQMGMAMMGYADEAKLRIPGPNWRRAHHRGWLYSDLQMDQLEHLRSGLMWPYLRGVDSYRCPDDYDEDPDMVPHRPNNSRMITSYCMNGSVCGYGHRAQVAATDGSTCDLHGQPWVFWDTYKWTEYEANDVIMWEADETTSQKGWWHDGSNFPWEGITQRHIDRGNTVCADGHAEWMLLTDYYAMDCAGKTRLWNTPGKANGRW